MDDRDDTMTGLFYAHSYAHSTAGKLLTATAFQFGQKSFDSIRFGNVINLPLVH